MAIPLKCPSCRERLFAEESDRGGSIRCPGCDSRVPVPTSSAGPPSARAGATVPVLKPIPPRPRPPADDDDDVVEAEVVTAPVRKTATAIPTVAPMAAPETGKPKGRTGFRQRGDDADEDARPRRRRDEDRDDEDDENEPAAGGNGLLFVILGVGVLLLAGIGVGVYFLTQGGDAPAVVENNPPQGVIPGPFNPNPLPVPGGGGIKPGPAIPDGWDTVQTADGFTFLAPTAGRGEGPTAAQGLTGKVWTGKELGGIGVAGGYLDRPAIAQYRQLILYPREAFQLNGGRVVGPRRINGRAFTEFLFDGGPVPSKVWVHLTEFRLFFFRFTGDVPPRSAAEEKLNKFMANIKVTHPIGTVGEVDPGPGPGPQPPPKPPATPFEAVPTTADDGFTVELPGGAKAKGERHVGNIDRKYHAAGKLFETTDEGHTYRLYYHDFADESDYIPNKFLEALLPFPWKPAGAADAQVGGKPGQLWTIRQGNDTGLAATVSVGYRVYTLVAAAKFGARPGESAPERGKKFLDSLKITFDPAKAPAVASDSSWQPLPRTLGFTATGPRGTNDVDHTVGFGFDKPKGKHYSCEDDTVKCHVYIVQLGPKNDPDVTAKEMLGRDKIKDGPKPVTWNGMTGEEYTQEGSGELIRSRVVINRQTGVIAMVRVQPKGRDTPEREVLLKARAFFAGFRMGGGAVAGPGPGAVEVGDGEFASPGKVTPFWAAVALPNKKEILLLGARNPAAANPGGVLRRYSYPDFKLKATYNLPLPVNRAAADPTSGKLICSVISKYNPTLDQREAASWTSDLQIFDLNKITAGGYGEAEELKPLAKITVAQPITGLEVDPLGGFAYASAVVIPTPIRGQPPRPATGKLYKIDLTKNEVAGNPLLSREPLDGLRVAPAGKTLVTSETTVGPPTPGTTFNLLTVDTIAWKKSKLIPIPSPAKDLTFGGDGILALTLTDGKTKVYGYTEGGPETVEVTPKDIPFAGFSYLRVTPDGKRAVASAGAKQNGLLVMAVAGVGEKATFTKVSSGTAVDGTTTGGHFILTPDSRFAVFNCGAVVDLTKTAASPNGKE